jgi:uncharacterized membrane protein
VSLTPLLAAPVVIQIHAFSAIAATGLGAVVLFARKGTPMHKLMGRVWVLLMLTVATSALFINEIRMIGPFSPIHLFVFVTYGGIGYGLWQIRRGDIARHRAAMQSVYFQALMLTGAFTLLPGRRMHDVLFGPDGGWAPALVVIGLSLTVTMLIYRRLIRGWPRA